MAIILYLEFANKVLPSFIRLMTPHPLYPPSPYQGEGGQGDGVNKKSQLKNEHLGGKLGELYYIAGDNPQQQHTEAGEG